MSDAVPTDPWQAAQYHRFQAEREAPFLDLCAWIEPHAGARVVDLGCGTGELTHRLHAHVGAVHTLGLDSSAHMLAQATAPRARHHPHVTFAHGDIAAFDARLEYDVVFSHAALHWIPDHAALFARLAASLRPGGQLAVQMPANFDHASQAALREVLAEAPFADALGGKQHARHVRSIADYAAHLHALGLDPKRVARHVYGHELPTTADAVEWMKGTTMTPYAKTLSPELYAALCTRVAHRLVERVGDHRPYFFTFERILLWARRRP